MTDAIVFVITAFMVGGEVFMAAWGIFSWTCVVAWLAVMLYLTWDIWGARVVELQRDLVAELEEGTPPDFSSQRVLPPSRGTSSISLAWTSRGRRSSTTSSFPRLPPGSATTL